MVQLTTAATATVAVILAASAYAAPVANVEGTDIDVSARSEHSHTHAHGTHHHHHATPSRRDLDNVEDLDARFFRKIARKIFGRDLSSVETELEARAPAWNNKIGNRDMRRELQGSEELEARFIRRIARKIFGREFDELNELEARHEHNHQHHHLHEHVKRALEGMSDEELQARAPIFRRIARKIFGRDLSDEELEARAPFFFLGKVAKKVFGRELEEDLEARGLMLPGRRYPVGWKGAVRPRELEVEDRYVCLSFLIY
ncbi:hypothetical protein EST38_g10778 [Candolleomyces aberdarensis]|uniref:Uncharacterized protein n=1 Tax=Candolleomyces aberdarensis TaxID=2316362 RepID=A0A4Q2D6J4_9AGAR|nr:hypothetical protein EST38_g10778 [Candolleomyces aberdarensis]